MAIRRVRCASTVHGRGTVDGHLAREIRAREVALVARPNARLARCTELAQTSPMLRSPLARLRLVGFLEGVSFLVLLGIAMPMKYVLGMPLAVRIAGMTHGIFFLLFVQALAATASELDWPARRSALAFVAALIPFGPFVLDRKLLAEEEAKGRAA